MDDQLSDPNAREETRPDQAKWSPSDGKALRRTLIAEARAAIRRGQQTLAEQQRILAETRSQQAQEPVTK